MLKNYNLTEDADIEYDSNRYFEKYKTPILQHIPLLADIWHQFIQLAEIKIVSKGIVILGKDQYEKEVRYLAEGVVKIMCHNQYDYFVYDFRESNNFLCDPISLLQETPSRFSMETITNCLIISIPRDRFIELMKNNQEVKDIMTTTLNYYLNKNHEKHINMRSLSATDRYEQFCIDFPKSIRCAKLFDVASYLGITQQSLSRIRK